MLMRYHAKEINKRRGQQVYVRHVWIKTYSALPDLISEDNYFEYIFTFNSFVLVTGLM